MFLNPWFSNLELPPKNKFWGFKEPQSSHCNCKCDIFDSLRQKFTRRAVVLKHKTSWIPCGRNFLGRLRKRESHTLEKHANQSEVLTKPEIPGAAMAENLHKETVFPRMTGARPQRKVTTWTTRRTYGPRGWQHTGPPWVPPRVPEDTSPRRWDGFRSSFWGQECHPENNSRGKALI